MKKWQTEPAGEKEGAGGDQAAPSCLNRQLRPVDAPGHAASCIRYNKAWHKSTGIPLVWIRGAGHNGNTDAPEKVNALILKLVERL